MFFPGEIVIATFPFTDFRGTKKRPVLILGRCESSNDFLAAYITSSEDVKKNRFSVIIPDSGSLDSASGLKRQSAIRADKLATLNIEVLRGVIGDLDRATFESLKMKIAEFINQ
jgi:mRNA interferase MazF